MQLVQQHMAAAFLPSCMLVHALAAAAAAAPAAARFMPRCLDCQHSSRWLLRAAVHMGTTMLADDLVPCLGSTQRSGACACLALAAPAVMRGAAVGAAVEPEAAYTEEAALVRGWRHALLVMPGVREGAGFRVRNSGATLRARAPGAGRAGRRSRPRREQDGCGRAEREGYEALVSELSLCVPEPGHKTCISAGVCWLGRGGACGRVAPPVRGSSSAPLPPRPPAAIARLPMRLRPRTRARTCWRPCKPLMAGSP